MGSRVLMNNDILVNNSKISTVVMGKERKISPLVIIGDEYNFSDFEMLEINKNFSQIIFIKNINIESEKIISQIKKYSNVFVILNSNTSLFVSLLSSLDKEDINYLKIQDFMEAYFEKCYIPIKAKNHKLVKRIKSRFYMNRVLKSVIDYSAVFSLGILGSPFILYSIYRIKKESPGPVFFKQKRVGLNGKEFECIKLRSMNLDAEKNGAQFATENDSRIFAWGKTMRSTRIDELPQLWNILKGDMHLIGPRPERKVWINQFEKEIPHYNERHSVKPGVTGWAQVLYPYGADIEDAKQKLMYDLYYIKHWSLWLELKTVWKTVMVVLMKKGI